MAISPSYIGQVGNTGVYRVSLADLGISIVGELAVLDDRHISGGTGAASGFDLDFIKISSVLTSDPATAAGLTGLGVFRFDAVGTQLSPGYEQPWSIGDTAAWNRNYLFGTLPGTGGTGINFAGASLATRDGTNSAEAGALSIGEGGAVSFSLTSITPTAGLYLYYGDAGGGNDDSFVAGAPSQGHNLLPKGLNLVGTSGNDVIALGTGLNVNLGPGDDHIYGSGGDDNISTGAGNDVIAGGAGNDFIDGGPGYDTAAYRGLRSEYTVVTNPNGSITVQDQVAGRDGTDTLVNVEAIGFANPTAYRFFDTHDGGHFFTASATERDTTLKNRPDLRYEGQSFLSDDSGTPGASQVYRFFDTHDGGHFFTANAAERDTVIRTRPDLRFEGVGFYEHTTSTDG